jgi:hypothetical protein
MAKQDAEKRERPKKPARAKNAQGTAPVKPTGRPSTYDPIKAESICEQLSEGIPLREICRQPGMPAWRTVYDWMYQDEDLTAAIAHARDLGCDQIAEECLSIADDASNDWMLRTGKDGEESWQLNGEHVQRSKLRIETRLKLLAKFNPKKYGDALKLSGDKDNPLRLETELKAKEMFDGVIEALEAARRKKS